VFVWNGVVFSSVGSKLVVLEEELVWRLLIILIRIISEFKGSLFRALIIIYEKKDVQMFES